MKDYFSIRSTRQLVRCSWEELDLRIKFKDIVDNCTTPSSLLPLSANQGKVLRDLIHRIDSDDDGTVDNAMMLDGHPSSYYARHDAADTLLNALLAQPNGICPLDPTGFVPSEFLPSYVDDVVEVWIDLENNKLYQDEEHTIPMVPAKGKIYINNHDSISYRWSGSRFQNISSPDMIELTEEEVIALWNQVANEVHNSITHFIFTLGNSTSDSKIDAYVNSDNEHSAMLINFLNEFDGILGTMTINIGARRNYHVDEAANIATSIASQTRKVTAVIMDASTNSALSEVATALIVG